MQPDNRQPNGNPPLQPYQSAPPSRGSDENGHSQQPQLPQPPAGQQPQYPHAAQHHQQYPQEHAGSPPQPQQPPAPPQHSQQFQASERQYAASAQPQNTQLQTTPGQEAQSQVFWMSRPHMPEAPDIPEEAKKRHDESKRLYPGLNLSRGEFIISAVRRHSIGLISIWLTSGLIVFMALGLLMFTFLNQGSFSSIFGNDGGSGMSLVLLAGSIALLLSALAVVGGFIATYVYKQNKFFLTNESVIQCIQRGLFSRREQTVSLQNIEDASYYQHGIIQHMFNYGNIRLSTQGDETTYRFSYVKSPKHQIALLNNAVEAFKNGRPVMHLED